MQTGRVPRGGKDGSEESDEPSDAEEGGQVEGEQDEESESEESEFDEERSVDSDDASDAASFIDNGDGSVTGLADEDEDYVYKAVRREREYEAVGEEY